MVQCLTLVYRPIEESGQIVLTVGLLVVVRCLQAPAVTHRVIIQHSPPMKQRTEESGPTVLTAEAPADALCPPALAALHHLADLEKHG